MHDMKWRSRARLLIFNFRGIRRQASGMAAILLLSAGFAQSQTEAAASNSSEKGASPFAATHDSLMQKAEVILSSREPESGKASLQAQDQVDGAPHRVESKPSQQEWKKGRSSGLARLELLKPTILPVLEKQNMPVELAAIILRESGASPTALSSKGARGLWQLMPDTARRYGLTVDGTLDERLDVEKSTIAATRYLKDLWAQFGSWPLVLAAYNAGEHGVQRAIDRNHSLDFSVLSSLKALPAETRGYVPAVLADMSRIGDLAMRRPSAEKGTVVFALSAEGRN